MENPHKNSSKKYWYLELMAPNIRGAGFAWLDPSPIYLNAEAFQDCVSDLLEVFDPSDFDVVAGVDATGFILGSAMAIRLKKGFLTLRKKDKICVKTIVQPFTNYRKTEQILEIRDCPFPIGTRVLIVDQWVETGGTMDAAVKLVERCGGVVAGLVSIACETNAQTDALKRKYKISTCIPAHLQESIDKQYLPHFDRMKSLCVNALSVT